MSELFQTQVDFTDILKSLETAKQEIDHTDTHIRNAFEFIDAHRKAIDKLYTQIKKDEEIRQKLTDLVHSLSVAMATSIVEQKQRLEVERLYIGTQRRNSLNTTI